MNAFPRTALDFANALLASWGSPRASQSVHVCERKYRDGRQIWPVKVLVIPAGETRGEYYAIYREQTIDALKTGLIDCEDLEIWEPKS